MKVKTQSLRELLEEFDSVLIPDIQRDYVMGSGGEKIRNLLQAMSTYAQIDKEFNFSCLVGYISDGKQLNIYDGQQRLVTIICMGLYLMKDQETSEERSLLNKLSFANRDEANQWLINPNQIKAKDVVDFTTYSLVELIKEFRDFETSITIEFLLDKVVFNRVLVDKLSDAEHFFLDINDGVHLQDYEVFKAELFHHAKYLSKEDLQFDFKSFALKVENRWLNFFDKITKDKDESEEEYLILFIKYCFRMIWIEEHEQVAGYVSENVKWIETKHLIRVAGILDNVITIDLKPRSYRPVNYSMVKPNIYDGQHWNLKENSYEEMVKVFLENIKNTKQVNKDVIVWCYITNLPKIKDNQDTIYDYLRLIKKILNNNREINLSAKFIYNSYKEQNLRYSRYSVKDIPTYYLKNIIEEDEVAYSNFLELTILLNSKFEGIIEDVLELDYYNEEYNYIIKKELKKIHSDHHQLIKKYEDLSFINGLVNNFLDIDLDECKLDIKYDEQFYEKISKLENITNNYNCILEFALEEKISWYKCMYEKITINWVGYTGKEYSIKASVLPHTWCDLFTSEQGIFYKDELEFDDFIYMVGDAWINSEGNLIKPGITSAEGGRGFSVANSIKGDPHTIILGNINNFIEIFKFAKGDNKGNFSVTGYEVNELPSWLTRYNGKNWISNKFLGAKEPIYFNSKKNDSGNLAYDKLNLILLKMFKIQYQNVKQSDGVIYSAEEYINKYASHISHQKLYGYELLVEFP